VSDNRGDGQRPDVENVIILGSGPAGYTGALYTSRADLRPLVVEGFIWGGLLQQTTDVENYPGYPEGVLGPQMMQDFRAQAERFGTRFISEDATKLELSPDGGLHRVWVGDRELRAKAVILAMGAEPKKLGVPGEEELAARGVSYCATCDAAFFRGRQTIVVGGGDTAMEDATFLSKFADKVTIVHRRDEFRASAIMVDRAREADNIEFLTPYGTRHLPIDGAFVAIGHRPNSDLLEGQLELDDQGYVVVDGQSTHTGLRGVFAAGDLVDHTYRQAVTAAGTGCMAALDAEWYLRDRPPDPEAHWAHRAPAAKQSAEAPAG
jgi:thioredoxin reductase (NADPH)